MRDEDIQKEDNYRGNRHPLDKQGEPRMEMAVTIRLLRGQRLAFGTGSGSCMPIAKSVRAPKGSQRPPGSSSRGKDPRREKCPVPQGGGQESTGGGSGMGPLPAWGGLEDPGDCLILERGTGWTS